MGKTVYSELNVVVSKEVTEKDKMTFLHDLSMVTDIKLTFILNNGDVHELQSLDYYTQNIEIMD